MNWSQTAAAIKSLKIQGAESIAKSALLALDEELHKSRAATAKQLLSQLGKARKAIESARPTEPFVRNNLAFCFHKLEGLDLRHLREEFLGRIRRRFVAIEKNKEIIAEIGARKIMNGAVVFTHCHSSTVMEILKKAKQDGKKFVVHNTEARPFYQGRTSAEELARQGIKVVHWVDSAVRLAMKKADIALFGCDAITPTRIINKIGSELFAETAERLDVPLYVATDSLKFDPRTIKGYPEEIEERPKSEVWQKPPKGVEIRNPAFEKINPELVTGIISEFGIYKHQMFIEELEHNHPWLFASEDEQTWQ